MPTDNQEARAFLAAQRAREAARAMPAPQPSPEEATIQRDVSLPGPISTLQGMMQPGNVIRAAGEGIGGYLGGASSSVGGPVAMAAGAKRGQQIGGLVSQPFATAAQRSFDAFLGQPHDSSFLSDLGYDTVTNEIANRVVSPALGKVSTYLGQSAPVQAARNKIAEKILGTVTPTAREALTISDGVISDLVDAVNNVRQGNGQPLYTRDQVEERISEFLPVLKRKGMFTIGDLTTGTPTDVIEGISEGSMRGRARFGKKKQAADMAMEEWPKVFAAALGDPAQGPDALARMAANQIDRSVRKVVRSAGRKVGNVEKYVRNDVVPIDEGILAGLEDEITLFAKRQGGTDGKIDLDPERIDQPIKAGIGLVEKATGKKFDYKTGQFVDRLLEVDPKILEYAKTQSANPEAQRQLISEMMAAEGVSLPSPTDFTFRDVRKLRSYLGQMSAKIPEAERRSAAASLNGLSDALKDRQLQLLRARDAEMGNTGPRSLAWQWEAANTAYGQAANLREGFKAKGWIEALDKSGSGAKVIRDIWPDDVDVERIGNLKELLGGDQSPYWRSLRRFKVEEMLSTHGKNPEFLLKELTSPTRHSADYWEQTLGPEDTKRLLDFAKLAKFRKFGNPGKGKILGSMMDSGVMMQGLDLPMAAATGAVGAKEVSRKVARPLSWFVSTKKVAEWLTNPKDSSMFMAILNGSPIKRKASREWFRNQVARAVADASMTEDPVIRPLPASVSREEYAPVTGRTPASGTSYSGTRG